MENEQSAGYLEERTPHKEAQVAATESSITMVSDSPLGSGFLWGAGRERVGRRGKRNGLGLETQGSKLQTDYPFNTFNQVLLKGIISAAVGALRMLPTPLQTAHIHFGRTHYYKMKKLLPLNGKEILTHEEQR